MGTKVQELVIPEAARKDPKSVEVVRAWVAKGGLHCSLNIGAWKDPATWGILLADLARHVANAHAEMNGADREKVIARIRQLFDAELDRPTDNPTGSFQ